MMRDLHSHKVAVLLAAYNGIQWIEEQVDTILNQTGVEVSLFISVDLSSDGTYEWCLQLEKIHNNVIVLPYGERFGGAGPNFFRLIREVDFSSFHSVSFADQDDAWLPTKLKRAYEVLESSQSDVYSSNVIAFWENGDEVLLNKSQPQKKLDHFFEAAGPGCTYVFSQVAIQALKHIVVNSADDIKRIALHDWLAYAFCREYGLTWYIDDWASMRYRQHKNNQIGANNNFSSYNKRFAMIRNKWLREQSNFITALLAPEKQKDLNNRFYLISNFKELRRRTRDRVFFLFMLIFDIY